MNIGLKLLTKNGESLRTEGRIKYPADGSWITVPGNGAYLAITGGLTSGGVGPVIAVLEYDPSSKISCNRPDGVECYTRVRRVPKLESEYAARSKAYAARSKAYAAWSKAYAAWSKAYAAWSKEIYGWLSEARKRGTGKGE